MEAFDGLTSAFGLDKDYWSTQTKYPDVSVSTLSGYDVNWSSGSGLTDSYWVDGNFNNGLFINSDWTAGNFKGGIFFGISC